VSRVVKVRSGGLLNCYITKLLRDVRELKFARTIFIDE